MIREKKTTFTGSTLWLIPMYRITMAEWKRAGIIDAYLTDEVKVDKVYEGLTVRLLFRVDEEKYQLIEDAISTIPEFIDMYGLGTELIVVVLRIPEEFEDDYQLIMEGKYSQLSAGYKEVVSDRIINNKAATFKTNGKRLQAMIIDRAPQVKDIAAKTVVDMSNVQEGEIWEKIVPENEVINQSIIDNLIYE